MGTSRSAHVPTKAYKKHFERPPSHSHVAPAPPYVQRSLRGPLFSLRQASGTDTPAATTAAAAADRVASSGPCTAKTAGKGDPFALELVKLAPPCIRLRIEGPDLLQADEAPRKRLFRSIGVTRTRSKIDRLPSVREAGPHTGYMWSTVCVNKYKFSRRDGEGERGEDTKSDVLLVRSAAAVAALTIGSPVPSGKPQQMGESKQQANKSGQ